MPGVEGHEVPRSHHAMPGRGNVHGHAAKPAGGGSAFVCLFLRLVGGSELLPQGHCRRHLPPVRGAAGAGSGTGSSRPFVLCLCSSGQASRGVHAALLIHVHLKLAGCKGHGRAWSTGASQGCFGEAPRRCSRCGGRACGRLSCAPSSMRPMLGHPFVHPPCTCPWGPWYHQARSHPQPHVLSPSINHAVPTSTCSTTHHMKMKLQQLPRLMSRRKITDRVSAPNTVATCRTCSRQ